MSRQMKTLSVDIVGCGDFGTYVAELLNTLPRYEISSVCDADLGKAQELGKKLGVPAFGFFEECLGRSQAAAVALFTPNHLHSTMAVEAARHGKHVFCEKPMANTV